MIVIRIMKTTKKSAPRLNEQPVSQPRNPEVIEKFYKQIVNSFGYAYPGKA